MNAARLAERQAVWRDVGRHEAAGADDGVRADRDARQDDGTGAEPDAIPYEDWPSVRAVGRLMRVALFKRNDALGRAEWM